jgi:hypothetical protein
MMTTFMIDLVGNIFVVDTQCLHVIMDFSIIDRHRLDASLASGYLHLSLTMPLMVDQEDRLFHQD